MREAAAGEESAASIGGYLARQRQLRRISLDELAALTKIPLRSLERLEAGAFDHAPDGFARGFVRTVASALGLDPAEAVMRLMNEPDAEEPEAGARSLARRLPVLGVALGALLVLTGLLLWRLLASQPREPGTPRTPEVVVREDPVRALAREEAERAAAPREP